MESAVSAHKDMTFNRDAIISLFNDVGRRLEAVGSFAEVAICGSVSLMLQFDANRLAHDIDFISVNEESYELLEAIEEVADENGLDQEWFNDAVRFFQSSNPSYSAFGDFPPGAEAGGLRVYLATPQYLLAMSLISANRTSDIWSLTETLGITEVDELESLFQSFYPSDSLRPENRAMLCDMFAQKQAGASYDPAQFWSLR